MKTLDTKILEKIIEQNIYPKSKIYFLFKNIFIWISVLSGLLLSGFFSAGLFFIFSNRVLIDFLSVLALVGCLLIIIFFTFFMSYIQFKKIKNMYRKHIGYICIFLLVCIFISSFFMTHHLLYGRFDNFSARHFPSFSLENKIYHDWSIPQDKNKLAIEIISIDNNGYLYGEDFKGTIHMVDPVLLDREGFDIIFNNLRILMFGFQEAGIFYPETVKPWAFKYRKGFSHPYYTNPVVNDNINFGN